MKSTHAAYLPYIRRRRRLEQERMLARHERAQSAARMIADLLRRDFGAQEVIAFGSLVHAHRFGERSDIDLAVSGIAPRDFFRAWHAAGEGCPFEVDLVDIDDCSATLRSLIAEEGESL